MKRVGLVPPEDFFFFFFFVRVRSFTGSKMFVRLLTRCISKFQAIECLVIEGPS